MRLISNQETYLAKAIIPSQEEQAVWEDLGNIEHHDYGEPEHGAFTDCHGEFERKLDDYGLWDGHETPFLDDMENVAQAWERAEHEQMLDEILQDIGSLLSLMHKLN